MQTPRCLKSSPTLLLIKSSIRPGGAMTSIKIYFSLLNIRELYFTVLVEHVFNYGREKKVGKELSNASYGIPSFLRTLV